jgi:hypothetical protein
MWLGGGGGMAVFTAASFNETWLRNGAGNGRCVSCQGEHILVGRDKETAVFKVRLLNEWVGQGYRETAVLSVVQPAHGSNTAR